MTVTNLVHETPLTDIEFESSPDTKFEASIGKYLLKFKFESRCSMLLFKLQSTSSFYSTTGDGTLGSGRVDEVPQLPVALKLIESNGIE